VATETFFEKPYHRAEHHAELFAEFLKYYRVDPRAWMTAPLPPPPAPSYEWSPTWSH
jgi:Mlc titration factor MtfA (ptsG expression regulator)